eukprot:1142012-Pelagomonas_calceolata.AAC.1
MESMDLIDLLWWADVLCIAWRHGVNTDSMKPYGISEIGADVQCPLTDSPKCVEPNGAKITNTTCRAELAAIAAAITQSHSHIASDNLTSTPRSTQHIQETDNHHLFLQSKMSCWQQQMCRCYC